MIGSMAMALRYLNLVPNTEDIMLMENHMVMESTYGSTANSMRVIG